MQKSVIHILLTVLFLLPGCSTVGSVYVKNNYNTDKTSMVKKVIVAVKPDEKNPELTPLISNIAADIIRLRTNYLVYDYISLKDEKFSALCGKNMEGIFLFTIEDSEILNERVKLSIKSELYSCSENELLWRTSGSGKSEKDNEDLKELTVQYGKKYTKTATEFAAPAFVIIQDIIETVPDPELTDEEIDAKIKLEADR